MEVFCEYARAFLCGGALCLIGQLLIDKTKLTPVSYTHLTLPTIRLV